ncbi:hypothetical protein V8F20_008183 [Naviculisporaceae sp. PSN 640]
MQTIRDKSSALSNKATERLGHLGLPTSVPDQIHLPSADDLSHPAETIIHSVDAVREASNNLLGQLDTATPNLDAVRHAGNELRGHLDTTVEALEKGTTNAIESNVVGHAATEILGQVNSTVQAIETETANTIRSTRTNRSIASTIRDTLMNIIVKIRNFFIRLLLKIEMARLKNRIRSQIPIPDVNVDALDPHLPEVIANATGVPLPYRRTPAS